MARVATSPCEFYRAHPGAWNASRLLLRVGVRAIDAVRSELPCRNPGVPGRYVRLDDRQQLPTAQTRCAC